MIYGSVTMQASFSGTHEHRWVPLGMSIFASALAGWLLLRQILSKAGDTKADAMDPRGFLVLILTCVLLFALYAQASIWFGYLAATCVSGVAIFRLFRNRWIASLVQSVLATLVLCIVFFKLLRLYTLRGVGLTCPFRSEARA